MTTTFGGPLRGAGGIGGRRLRCRMTVEASVVEALHGPRVARLREGPARLLRPRPCTDATVDIAPRTGAAVPRVGRRRAPPHLGGVLHHPVVAVREPDLPR